MFTLCERFEGKHKAATQWVDYKLGLSFKQTEFINTEFPHTQLAGPSLLAYYCGSNTDEAYPRTLMHLYVCVSVRALCLHLLVCHHITSMCVCRHPRQHLDGLISGCRVVLRHARGDDLGSPCPIEGLQVPEYPLCASCSEWGVIALLAWIHTGPSAAASLHPWARCQALPRTASLTHPPPPNGTPPHIQAHPYASAPDPHHPPKNSSTHYHQPSVPHS